MKTIIVIVLVLITFSMCQGPSSTTSTYPQTNTVSNDRAEIIATLINLNGLLCAQVQSVNKLQIPDEYEVICTTYRGGTSTSTYIVNKTTGKAFEQ